MNAPWNSGSAYERYMGRWSILIGREFLGWLGLSPGLRWLDVGCGTGSLARLIADCCHPQEVTGVDLSGDFVSYAQASNHNPFLNFSVGDAQALDFDAGSRDGVVSGLMLNFVPQPEAALREMLRVVKPGGKVGIFIWDYDGGMKMLRYFWDAAVLLDGQARALDEAVRFPLAREGQLASLALKSGMKHVEARAIECQSVFHDFQDYWEPFLGNVGPAPAYVAGLDPDQRTKLEEQLRRSVPTRPDGSIALAARAWAVKGTA